MKIFAIAFAAGLLLGLSGLTSQAGADSADTLEAECHKQLKLGDSGCACVSKRARDKLNDKQQELVVAMVTRDHAKSAALQGELTSAETQGATQFMRETPQACAAQ